MPSRLQVKSRFLNTEYSKWYNNKEQKGAQEDWDYARNSTLYFAARYFYWVQQALETTMLKELPHTLEILGLVDAVNFQFTGSMNIQGDYDNICSAVCIICMRMSINTNSIYHPPVFGGWSMSAGHTEPGKKAAPNCDEHGYVFQIKSSK